MDATTLEKAMARAGIMPRDISGRPMTIRAAAERIIKELDCATPIKVFAEGTL